MKTTKLLLTVLSILFLFSACQKIIDEKTTPIVKPKLSGHVQKGPFVNGTSIQMYELDDKLNQTGKSFTTSITDNKGTFEIANINLSSQYVELYANGYYFNENTDSLSSGLLELDALSDITNLTSVNVNIMTHLEKSRVEYLVGKGLTFTAAKDSAQNEILAIFGFKPNSMDASEKLDISVNNDENAILLAISVILQGDRSVAQLTELLANISTDIQQDGKLDNKTILSDLRNSALKLNITGIRGNLQNKYTTATIPPYETYINDFIITTGGYIPTLITTAPSLIGGISATSGGNITWDGGAAIIAKGVCWNTSGNPTISDNITNDGSGSDKFNSSLTNLKLGTTYYVRAYTTNTAGTGYGNQITFTTLNVPTTNTLPATNINQSDVTLNGSVNPNGISTIVSFEYGTTTDYGDTVSATQSPVTGNTTTNINATITGLIVSTSYHFRVKSVNSLGTIYGNDVTFVTTITGITSTVSDIDGNTYKTIGIGYQMWMAENLKTTKYRDGSDIPTATDNTTWESLTTGAYSWYNNDINYKNPYGAYYNFYSVVDSRNLCPLGWHVPTNDEWTTLYTFLGGHDVAGGKLKETGLTHWDFPNTGATNETGFTELPGGARQEFGPFNFIGIYGYYWTSSEFSTLNGYLVGTAYNNGGVWPGNLLKTAGFSIRCLKD
jgi:uncharacterized protein (TIGR02145 family)